MLGAQMERGSGSWPRRSNYPPLPAAAPREAEPGFQHLPRSRSPPLLCAEALRLWTSRMRAVPLWQLGRRTLSARTRAFAAELCSRPLLGSTFPAPVSPVHQLQGLVGRRATGFRRSSPAPPPACAPPRTWRRPCAAPWPPCAGTPPRRPALQPLSLPPPPTCCASPRPPPRTRAGCPVPPTRARRSPLARRRSKSFHGAPRGGRRCKPRPPQSHRRGRAAAPCRGCASCSAREAHPRDAP